ARRRSVRPILAKTRCCRAPARYGRGPFVRQLADHRKARPGVLSAFGVVCGSGRQRRGPSVRATLHEVVKLRWLHAERIRLRTHLVERNEAIVAVKDGVLDRLGHQRTGGLLEASYEGLSNGRSIGGFEQQGGDKPDDALVFDFALTVDVSGGC